MNCPDCVARGYSVWVEDAHGRPVGKCPNPVHPWNADAKTDLIAAVAGTKAFEAAKAIILDGLDEYTSVTADELRDRFDAAQIPQGTRGAAFAALSQAGQIKTAELVTSGKTSVHGKSIGRWVKA